MRLLITTQKVDKKDPILGFFHRWLEEFAKHCERLIVVCLECGDYSLPPNVKVLSLGKEKHLSRWQYLIRFYKYIWKERKNYDTVFVHMNVEYIILGCILWKVLNKKITLWYMHKSVTWKLRLAEKFSNIIFTGTRESFRLLSKKLHVLHHGIDTKVFSFHESTAHDHLNLLSVSRISTIKQIELMIDLVNDLKNKIGPKVILKIVGIPITIEDQEYFKSLKFKINNLNLSEQIIFVGAVSNDELPIIYQAADIFLNFSQTGSLDKAILEAASCGTLVVSSNDSAKNILPKELFIDDLSIKKIVDKIIILNNLPIEDKNQLRQNLSKYVLQNHGLSDLISQIIKLINIK